MGEQKKTGKIFKTGFPRFLKSEAFAMTFSSFFIPLPPDCIFVRYNISTESRHRRRRRQDEPLRMLYYV